MILINGKEQKLIKFPIGEININLDYEKTEICNITFLYEENEFQFLIMLLKELRPLYKTLNLCIPYLPYSREDRAIEGHVFALQHIAEDINKIGLDNVYFLDAHS